MPTVLLLDCSACAASLGRGGARIDAVAIERLAIEAHRGADLGVPFPTPRLLARALGLRLLLDPVVPRSVGVLRVGDVIRYHHDPDPRRMGLAFLVALAGALLDASGAPHAEADTWRLALALGLPLPAYHDQACLGALTLRQLAETQRHLPEWALALRLVHTAEAITAGAMHTAHPASLTASARKTPSVLH